MIRMASPDDASAIAAIYNYYILNTTITLKEEVVSSEIMRERIKEIIGKYPWIVYEQNGKVMGYAYACAWKSRCAYRYSVETSVYLQKGLTQKGIGTALYSALLAKLGDINIHSVIGGMALPNDQCVALHEKFRFEKVTHFKEVGIKFGKWIDVAYYEKIL